MRRLIVNTRKPMEIETEDKPTTTQMDFASDKFSGNVPVRNLPPLRASNAF